MDAGHACRGDFAQPILFRDEAVSASSKRGATSFAVLPPCYSSRPIRVISNRPQADRIGSLRSLAPTSKLVIASAVVRSRGCLSFCLTTGLRYEGSGWTQPDALQALQPADSPA